jgi:hypothetical protein
MVALFHGREKCVHIDVQDRANHVRMVKESA